MYLFDTNVLSEVRKLRRRRTDPVFAEWSGGVAEADIYVATLSLSEIETGIQGLRRRDPAQARVLYDWYEAFVLVRLAERTLPFDIAAARAAAQLPVDRTLPSTDAMLAGTAELHNLTVATRNVKDFVANGIPFVNPWDRSTWL